jgi:hypothetical protein
VKVHPYTAIGFCVDDKNILKKRKKSLGNCDEGLIINSLNLKNSTHTAESLSNLLSGKE